MEKLVNLEKYGFKINNKYRKDWAKSNKIFIRKRVLLALLKAKSFLPEGYNFEIHDGKRSKEDQRRIIKICEEDFKNRYPKNWKEKLLIFTGGYEILKSKPKRDTHLGGGAVDLTILDKKEKELDMGEDSFDEKESLNYYENKKKLTKREEQIKKNRRLLKRIMKKVGFKPYLKEWHHWGFNK